MLRKSIPPSTVLWFDQSEKNIVLALDEIRKLSYRLAPTFFDETKVEKVLRKLFFIFNIEAKYQILLEFETVKKIPIRLEVELNLYRKLKEQLRNI